MKNKRMRSQQAEQRRRKTWSDKNKVIFERRMDQKEARSESRDAVGPLRRDSHSHVRSARSPSRPTRERARSPGINRGRDVRDRDRQRSTSRRRGQDHPTPRSPSRPPQRAPREPSAPPPARGSRATAIKHTSKKHHNTRR